MFEAWIILTHIFVTFSENVENLSFFQLTLHHEQVNPYNIYTIYEIYHIYKIYCLEQNPCDPPGWHPPSLSPTNAPRVEWIPSICLIHPIKQISCSLCCVTNATSTHHQI